jgi:hypothetical protein
MDALPTSSGSASHSAERCSGSVQGQAAKEAKVYPHLREEGDPGRLMS